MALRSRTKKLIGAVLTLLWLPLYALFAMALGLRILPHAGTIVQFLYYAVAGMAWIFPIGLMLPWMSRDPEQEQDVRLKRKAAVEKGLDGREHV
jgi:hypothetical protein